MAKPLTIQRLKAPDYAELRSVTHGFKDPVVFKLSDPDRSRLQQLKTEIFAFVDYQDQAAQNGEQLASISEEVKSSVSKDYKASQIFTLFLTQDKVISPVGFASDRYIELVETITQFFFTTAFLQARFQDSSILHKTLIFSLLKKGIFGSFKPAHLSNFVNVNYSSTQGNTNTIIHSDSGLCNFFTQVEGRKRWWIASPYQRKSMIQEVFQGDITQLDLNQPSLQDLEYYDLELEPEEVLYVPGNWLHGVVAPPGKNLSFYCRFPMLLRDLVKNLMYWRAMGVPLNRYKMANAAEQKTVADLAKDQAQAFNQLKFHLRKHAFSSRPILADEPDMVVGLYDLDRVSKAVAGAE